MRILFTPVASTSTPLFHMVPLAWAARAAGHDVRIAAQPDLTAATVGVGLPAVEVGHGYGIMAGVLQSRGGQRVVEAPAKEWVTSGLANSTAPAGDGTPATPVADEHRRLRNAAMVPLVEAASRMAPDLLRFAERWRPHLMVTDPMVFAAPLVSHTLGIPLVRQIWGPDMMRLISNPLQGQPTTGDERDQWPTGLPELYDQFGVPVRNDYPVRTIDPWPGSLQLPDVVGRLPIRFIPYNGAAATPDWVLDRPEHPRVCVTWGTSTTALAGDEGFILPRVVAALAGIDIEVALAVSSDDRQKLGRLPANVRVAENVPIHLFMSTCDAIVNQGGTSSLLTAACSGIPQVMMPQTADTPFTAANFTASGAGLILDVTEANAEDIRTAVRDVLTDHRYQTAAQAVRDEIVRTPPPPAVVRALEALV